MPSDHIKCSYHGEVISKTDCLACARRNIIPPCGLEFTLLSALFSGEDRSAEIHVTDLVHCLRKSFLDKTSPEPEFPHKMLARFKGIAIHEGIEKINAANQELGVEFPLLLDGIAGRLDVTYDNVLVDYKTAKEIYADRLPYGEHALQLNIYAHILRKMGRTVNHLVVVYIGGNGPSECKKCRRPAEFMFGQLVCPICGKEFPRGHLGAKAIEVSLLPEKEIDAIVTERSAILKKALAAKAQPDGEPSWLCRYCDHTCDLRDGSEE